MKLLVVDQDTDCRGDVARVLTQMGHRVEEFSTGREALRRLGQTPVPGEPQPQLVLTEMLTGEITGIDLLSWVRNVGDFRDIGVIFLTAPLDLDTLRQALDQGLTGYISKPLDLELLGSQVEDLVSCIPEVSEPGSMELASQSSLSSADDSLEDLDLSGEILEGKYGLDGLIAHGETGTVYRARNLGLDQAVAIQILDGSAGRTKRLFSRFIREIRKVSRRACPHIISVIDFGFTADSNLYLVMEMLKGRSLDQILALTATLPVDLAAQIMLQLAYGLEAAHEEGVLHLDIKPSNIMVSGTPQDLQEGRTVVHVLDLGIPRLLGRQYQWSLSPQGSVLGTASYISPEHCRGEDFGPWSDLYSLGAVAYEMLTGRPPYPGDSPQDLAYQHLHSPLQSPRVFRHDIPTNLENILLRLLSRDPADRLSNAQELVALLLDDNSGALVNASLERSLAESEEDTLG